jgi:DNA processing protein
MPRATRPLSDQERLDWLRLIRSENVGPITFFHLIRHYGSAAKALAALPELARRSGRTKHRLCTVAEAEREMAALLRCGARPVAWLEPAYPTYLAEIEDAPPLIAVRGDAALLERPTIAIVGARNASTNGCKIAERIARALGEAGRVVASGFARGIDTAAHRGALETGTVAAFAGGIDICYPSENQWLYDAVAERGAIVAEQPPGTEPLGRHFPRRNRIISGLASGVVVVEAALRSGSLITARLALEQGRDVFAVPGSPLDPRCQGTNNLIRQGAVLTESADDVLRDSGAVAARPQPSVAEAAPEAFEPLAAGDVDRARALLVQRLSPAPTAIDAIVRDTGLPPALVATALLELELAGRAERHPGNRAALIAA